MARWLSPLMAFCLSFMIIVGLAPALGLQIDRQIDFWLLWMGAMLLLALPLIYLEIALARRSKSSALHALSALTRDADASPQWRLVGWLAVVFIAFLAGALLSNIAQMALAATQFNINSQLIFGASAVAAVALSFVNRQILIAVTAVGVIASLIISNINGTALQPWHVTAVEFSEWGKATILALVASGLGLGIYWQSQLNQPQSAAPATHAVLPIWLAQLLAVGAFGFFAVNSPLPAYSVWGTAIVTAALLLQLAKEQLQQRQIAEPILWLILFAALLVWAVPGSQAIFNPLLMITGLLICLVYSIFVGWMMKISHLRKAMNFSNELFYNLWRIAVRLVIPLSIIVALVAYIGQLI